MDYDATGELLRLDSDQRVSITARPRFKVERSEPSAFRRISYAVSAARDNHTPPFAQIVINAIDLKAHQLHFDSRGLGSIGTKYDVALGKLEVHGQSHRPSITQEDDTSYPSDS
jgi:hypothetical protein